MRLPSQLLGLTENTSAMAKQSVSYLDKKYVAPLTAVLAGEKSAIYGGYVLYPPGFAPSLPHAASKTRQIHAAVVR